MIYLATPFANTKAKTFEWDQGKLDSNLRLCKKLEEAGFKICLPQRDVDQKMSAEEIVKKELEIIDNCDCLIAVLSDTRGLYLESGYAKGKGKKIIGVKVSGMRELSRFTATFYDAIVETPEELIECLRKLGIQQA